MIAGVYRMADGNRQTGGRWTGIFLKWNMDDAMTFEYVTGPVFQKIQIMQNDIFHLLCVQRKICIGAFS